MAAEITKPMSMRDVDAPRSAQSCPLRASHSTRPTLRPGVGGNPFDVGWADHHSHRPSTTLNDANVMRGSRMRPERHPGPGPALTVSSWR